MCVEDVRFRARVEEQAGAASLDEARESPVGADARDRRGVVVEIRDPDPGVLTAFHGGETGQSNRGRPGGEPQGGQAGRDPHGT